MTNEAKPWTAWTEEEAAKLMELYEHGGDKGCLPMRVIAKKLGRTEASCWGRVFRKSALAQKEEEK